MNIEAASQQDSEVLKNIAVRAILETVTASDEIKTEIIAGTMKHIEANLSGSDGVFLMCRDSSIVGFILIQHFWNLSDLFVLPSSHHKGVGRHLLTAALAACAGERGKGYVRVNSSINAEGFYRKMGFVSFAPEKPFPDFVIPLIYHF